MSYLEDRTSDWRVSRVFYWVVVRRSRTLNQQYLQEENHMDFSAGVRKLTLGALIISSFLLAGGATPSAAQTGKPNIVVIITHSLGSYLALIALNSDSLGPQAP